MLKILSAVGTIAIMMFVAPLIYVFFGAFAGWVISLVAPDLVCNGINAFGFTVHADQLPSIGAALGFFSSFFARSNYKYTQD